jgi:Ca-activated chloride channel family protein
MSKRLLLLCVLVCALATLAPVASAQEITQGALLARGKSGTEGDCPLKSTSVKTDITGFLARVRVRQEFENTFTEPIEAVYTFPLSQNGAVDDMTLMIGSRTIKAKIMKREEARKVYESAKDSGQTASLLDQERPNIFTQSVANIMPGEKILVEISYVETLKFDDGSYEFVFPMTVAPRYIPTTVDEDDAAKISPPAAETRAGHDISIEVNLRTGVPFESVRSSSHAINTLNLTANAATVSLKNERTIPNKDFVLRYDVIGKRMEDAVLATRSAKGGFFSLILSPPERLTSTDLTPKEIVFVLDTSGSMEGFPIEKAKESMKLALDGLYPGDTFNLITFAGDTHILFDQPVPATQENLDKAQEFLASRKSDGGTEMMKAVTAALAPSDAQDHLRIVCFMTDGEVGNDMDIIAEVKKHPKARVFSFGIGDSVNRFLLDGIAREGRGEAEYVMLEDDGSRAAKRFHERIRNPYLTDISIDWAGLSVSGVYPKRIPDLFGATPVVIFGRYSVPANATIKLRGKIGGQPFERNVTVNLPAIENANDVLATLWASTKVDELMSLSWDPESEESVPKPAIKAQITKLGIDYGVMTQYTSFVAVEERIVNRIRNGKKVRVPVYAPAGTVFEGDLSGDGDGYGYGSGSGNGVAAPAAQMTNLMANVDSLTLTVGSGGGMGTGSGSGTGTGRGSGSGSGYGSGGGTSTGSGGGGGGGREKAWGTPSGLVSTGVINGAATKLPKPAYPPVARAVNASGGVTIQVIVDESGKVISATPLSGHPLLRSAAVQAANNAVFAPTMLADKPVRVTGVITYNFMGPGSATSNVSAAAGSMQAEVPGKTIQAPPTPAMLRDRMLKEKMHSWVYQLVSRIRTTKYDLTQNEAKFVSNDMAAIQIELWEKRPEVLERLRTLGFEIVAEGSAHILTGRIAVEKLDDLAKIEEVKLILPKL